MIYEMSIPRVMYTFLQKTLLTGNTVSQVRCNCNGRLVEVGQLGAPRTNGSYQTGQLFLHKQYGYRGIILFPWTARVYDRDLFKLRALKYFCDPEQSTEEDTEYESQTYYSVLIDERDCPLVRAQTEAVTVLGDLDSSRSLYSVPGLDQAAHRDILPYKPTADAEPFQHNSLDNFLVFRPDHDPPYSGKATLQVWEHKTRPWLETSDIYRETTDDVRVTVLPLYLGCRGSHTYWWRYHVCLENLGDLSVQLRDRMWCVFSVTGGLPETERGRGVAGQEPVLSRRLPAFQYTGHVSLPAPNGYMWGYFRMEREDGHSIVCRTPWFCLESRRHRAATPSAFGSDD